MIFLLIMSNNIDLKGHFKNKKENIFIIARITKIITTFG